MILPTITVIIHNDSMKGHLGTWGAQKTPLLCGTFPTFWKFYLTDYPTPDRVTCKRCTRTLERLTK